MTAVVFPIYNWIGKPNKWENFGKQEILFRKQLPFVMLTGKFAGFLRT